VRIVSIVAVLTVRAGMSEIVVSGECNHYILIYMSSEMKSNTMYTMCSHHQEHFLAYTLSHALVFGSNIIPISNDPVLDFITTLIIWITHLPRFLIPSLLYNFKYSTISHTAYGWCPCRLMRYEIICEKGFVMSP
jgi:hypothetical protein